MCQLASSPSKRWRLLTTEKGACCGWFSACGTLVGLRQFKLRGSEKVSAVFGLHVIAYNLIRLGNLLRPAMAAA